jgi:tetratricopeptide (TPR) repeat protein
MRKKISQDAEQLFLKAQTCEKKSDWQSAITFYRSALKLRPNYLEAHHNLAIALRSDKQMESSLISALFATNIAPDHPIVQFSLGVSLEKTGEITDAIGAYQKSIELRPDYVAALSNLGRLLEVKGKTLEAIKVLEQALIIMPSSIETIINLSNSYLSAGKPKETIYLLQSLIKSDTKNSDTSLSLAFNSLAVAAHILGNRNKAIRYFKKSIKKMPNFAEAHENLAQTLLFQGKYTQAWVEYEWRWLNQSNQQSKQKFGGIPWNGEKLLNKTLLIRAEQGFGDIIQFARFLPMITVKKGNLILACHPILIDLLSTLPSVDRVVDINEELPVHDRHVALLSLPRLLNITESNIPSSPYLIPNSSITINETNKIKIGLTWAGTPRHQSDPYRNRSCPVDAFKPLLNFSEIKLFSLQTGIRKIDLIKINKLSLITDLSHKIHSFEDTAALICNLDIVITIDTAIAHLAGSLGKTVWILLAKSSDWRWNTKSGGNLWYPTARIFKQKFPGDWSGPIKDLTKELKRLIPKIR